MAAKLAIVIPCYQSEGNFPDLMAGMEKLLLSLPESVQTEFVLVDDGSSDQTWNAMLAFREAFPSTTLVKLTGNFGSYPAFLAGLHHSQADMYVQLHTDLQDPPDHIPEMISYWQQGWKLVIGRRTEREEGFFHRLFALSYHKMIKKFALPHIPEGGYDLILFDRSLRDEVVRLNESNINLVYLISSLKHPYVTIPIKRVKRTIGKSGWTFSRKVKLVVDSFVGFSYAPIRLLSLLAMFMNMAWFTYALLLIKDFLLGHSPDTFNLLLFVILLVSGLLAGMMAVLGEYLWRTLEAARKRAPFVVDKVLR
jgi:glycosyltransferase involved in cell wall biosynthesis